MAASKRKCELCINEASVYCASDSAYLCKGCDTKVHTANFLVARHIRSLICSKCANPADFCFSGASISPLARNLCKSCSPEDVDDDSRSSSSSCVSSTANEESASSAAKKSEERNRSVSGCGCSVALNLKVEGVLVNWCRRMSVDEKQSYSVVAMAVKVLGGCLGKMTVLPFRVSLATAVWVAIRVCGGVSGDANRDLRRLEQISEVPSKLILATECRLARTVKRRRSREDHEEGWAEC